jgi:peroxiredoxin
MFKHFLSFFSSAQVLEAMEVRVGVRNASIVLAVFLISLPAYRDAYAEDTAPDFVLTDIDDDKFSLADFRGTTVVLTFVATRVITCKMQVLILNNVSKYFGDDVIIGLIGIGNETLWVGGDTDEQLRQFREDCGFEGIVARDTKGVADDYNVTYVPTTFIIDQAGFIRHKHVSATQTGESVLFEELQVVIPEFSSPLILLATIIALTLAVTVINAARATRKVKNLREKLVFRDQAI